LKKEKSDRGAPSGALTVPSGHGLFIPMPQRRLPLRPSLLAEVTTILREGIAAGRWKERLPGERLLALELQVSRPTIGLALKTLEKEGVLESGAKKKRQILHSSLNPKKTNRPVVLVSPVPLEFMEQHTILWVDLLRQNLAKLDNELIILANRRAYSAGSDKILQQMVSEMPASCWVLTLSTREMQQWFFERGLPTVVTGSCFAGLSLHSIDLDFRAVGRHAAGMLLSRGHRRICLVNRHPIHGGDKLTEVGFLEAFEKRNPAPEPPLVLHHDGTPPGILTVMERIHRCKLRPDAYFVTNANHLLCVVSSLTQRGLVHGKDYALICRDNDAFLSYLSPPVPCYSRDHVRFSRSAFRLIRKAIAEPGQKATSLRIMPDFKPNGNG